MADLSGLRTSIETLAGKLTTLREVINAIQQGGVVQEALDDLQTRVDEISTELDAIIEEARGQGGNEIPAEPAPETPVVEHRGR